MKLNLLGLKCVLEKLLEKEICSKIQISNIHVKFSPSNTSRQTINAIISLRRIYGILYETTAFINSFIGVAIMANVVMTVVNNISSGYKVYLLYMGEIVFERVAGTECYNQNKLFIHVPNL